MKLPLAKLTSAVLSTALLSSCASIVSGTTQPIRFSSNPSGADVRVDGVNRARTPAELDISTRSSHDVIIELPGYQPYQTQLKRKLNGWIFGNIFFGGVIGVIVDASTGAMFGLTPREIDAQLNAAPHTEAPHARARRRSAQAGNDKLYIAIVMHADPSWKKIGQLTKR